MSGDRILLETMLAWRAAGHAVTLLTVARTWGVPLRPPGTLMAMRDDGATFGSIAGDELERELLPRLQVAPAGRAPTRFVHDTSDAESARLGLPRGGRIEVVAEQVAGDRSLIAAHAAVSARRSCVRRVNLGTGTAEIAATGRDFHCDQQRLERRFAPAWRLALFGATELARHLVYCAAHLDYEVILCDAREEVRSAWNLGAPGHAVTVDPRPPTDAMAAWGLDERTAVITLTHDPGIDLPLIEHALSGRPFYVDAAGALADADPRVRLHPLIGRSPAEIAIAVLGDVASARRHHEDLRAGQCAA